MYANADELCRNVGDYRIANLAGQIKCVLTLHHSYQITIHRFTSAGGNQAYPIKILIATSKGSCSDLEQCSFE